MNALLGSGLALAAALAWGSGDYAGGLASRRADPLRVVLVTALTGFLILFTLTLVRGETLPGLADIAWAASGGAAGAVGLVMLFRGLAVASAAVVAPTSAVVGAALPVVYGALASGVPGAPQLAGFGVGLAGIWLVAREEEDDHPSGRESATSRGLALGVLAGLGFGAFFVLIAQVRGEQLFAHLAVARGATLAVTLGALLVAQRGRLPSPRGVPLAWLAGLLDAAGNIFYLLAVQHTRVDIAAVLASLYPAATVLLAWSLSAQPIRREQWAGVGCCLVAVALIAS